MSNFIPHPIEPGRFVFKYWFGDLPMSMLLTRILLLCKAVSKNNAVLDVATHFTENAEDQITLHDSGDDENGDIIDETGENSASMLKWQETGQSEDRGGEYRYSPSFVWALSTNEKIRDLLDGQPELITELQSVGDDFMLINFEEPGFSQYFERF